MMFDRAWPNPFARYESIIDIAPTPTACPDCHDLVFPGATVCDSCGTPQSVTETASETTQRQ